MALIDNLVAYWKMDESSGNAIDSVNSYVLTNTGVTYNTGKILNGAQLGTSTGNSNTLLNTNISIVPLRQGSNKSFNWWFKVNNTPTSGTNRFFDHRRSGGNSAYLSAYYDSSGNLGFGANGSAGSTFNVGLSLSTWYMMTIACGSNNSTDVYLNGNLIGTFTWGNDNNASSDIIQIGNANGSTSGGHGGPFSVDEFGIWTKKLTSDEVLELYNNNKGLSYPFDNSNSGVLRRRLLI